MRRWFIPDTSDVGWSVYFLNDLKRQGGKMLILGEKENGVAFDLFKTEIAKAEVKSTDNWYVYKNWGKVLVDDPNIEDDLFIMGE